MIKEFIAFLKLYGVIGLAIAVIIGGKLNALVSSVVNDVLMPILFQPALKAAGVDEIAKLNAGGIFYGKALGASIDFIIVAFVVFVVAKFVFKESEVAKR